MKFYLINVNPEEKIQLPESSYSSLGFRAAKGCSYNRRLICTTHQCFIFTNSFVNEYQNKQIYNL